MLSEAVAAKDDVTLVGLPATVFDKTSDKALLIHRSTTRHPPTHVKAVSWFRYLADSRDFDLKKGFVTKWIGVDDDRAKTLDDSETFNALAVVPGSYALQSVILFKDGKVRRIHAKSSTQVITLAGGQAYFLNDVIFRWQMKNANDRPNQREIKRNLLLWLKVKNKFKVYRLNIAQPIIESINR